MRPTCIQLAIAMTALGVFGVLWAVYAQEISLPVPVLQPDVPPPEQKAPEKKPPAKPPAPMQSQREKSKADATLITPPEVFDVPPPPAFPPPTQNVPPAESKQAVIPIVSPEPTKMLIDPLTPDPPLPKKASDASSPPTLVFPPAQGNAPIPTADRPKSFVRLRTAANEITSPPLDVVSGSQVGGAAYFPPPPPPVNAMPNPNALFNLQTPAVTIEKRGRPVLRAGETQAYELVIRNLGPVPAQQVRIEEEIPAGAKLVNADPAPQWQGSKAIWIVAPLQPGSELIARFSLQAEIALQLGAATSVQVSAMQAINRTAMKPPTTTNAPTVNISGPERAMVGTPVTFDVHVANPAGLPLTGVKMFGYLSDGLDTRVGRTIEMADPVTVSPGGSKNLRMPTNAVAAGHHTVKVKVISSAGEAWATATIDIATASLAVRQAESTRLFLGRDGDLRIEVANGTGKPLRNIAVACLLPEGLEYRDSSDRGLFQANHHTVYWLIDAMPAGQARTLIAHVNGAKAGQYQTTVTARADGVSEFRSTGAVSLEGAASLKMRVVDRDNPLELGKDTVYEIQISNGGAAAAHNVRLQVQFAPGLNRATPRGIRAIPWSARP